MSIRQNYKSYIASQAASRKKAEGERAHGIPVSDRTTERDAVIRKLKEVANVRKSG